MAAPQNLKYDADQHLWIDIDGDTATIGITDYAQNQLGELLFVELPDEDDDFERGDEFSVVESGKKANGLEAPFGFTIIESNEFLDDEPEAINEDAFENWIVRVKITDEDGIDDLVDADAYEAACAE
ncbi:MAG: glycine cleavage system protein H [Eubacteriaceae bacterium]|jgi:glycine cleavage system H protein